VGPRVKELSPRVVSSGFSSATTSVAIASAFRIDSPQKPGPPATNSNSARKFAKAEGVATEHDIGNGRESPNIELSSQQSCLADPLELLVSPRGWVSESGSVIAKSSGIGCVFWPERDMLAASSAEKTQAQKTL